MWIIITFAAATFQILRTARQHELRASLTTSAAGFVRYAYGVPWAIVATIVLFGVAGRDLPEIPSRFWLIAAGGALAQIVGTVALLQAFKLRDFAIGTVYSKTEVLIVAGLAAVGLGTPLSALGWLGAACVTGGVAALAARGSLRSLIGRAGDPAAIMGLGAAAGFGLAAIGIGEAARSLDGAPSFDRAILTLTVVLTIQTVVNGVWFAATDPMQLVNTARAWRPAIWVGVFSVAGSLGWAWAFTLESAAKVRTLGQVELLIAFAIAHVQLHEHHRRSEYLAGAAVLVGVVIVAAFG